MELILIQQRLVDASILLAIVGTFIITLGAVRAAYKFIIVMLGNKEIQINSIRLELGYSIILGLEFLVGSDIIESAVRRTYYELGILAGLVIIRTFLSYFLNKELEVVAIENKDK